MIQQGSAYWLNKSSNNHRFDLLELASTQRAITNYVKILTNKEIPVNFVQNNGDSFTDGKEIVITSHITPKNVDEVVGLALHEASHCIFTNFKTLKYLGNIILNNNRYKHLFPNKDHVLLITNFIEDRRIDEFVYNSAPGYKGYYQSMYKKAFYSPIIDEGLKSNEYRDENWESYLFRIINIFNPNSDLNALYSLKQIYKIIDLDNINRLKNTYDSIKIAMEIVDIIRGSILANKIIQKDPDLSKYDKKNTNKGVKNGIDKSKLKKSFINQESFINHNIDRKNTLRNHEVKKINALNEANVEINKSKFLEKDVNVHVIKKLTDSVIKQGLYGVFVWNKWGTEYSQCFEKGINKGKKLLKKLQIRNESIILETNRLKKGKIDTRRIYASNFMEDIFKKIDKSSHKPISINLSIDGSGSMQGDKWKSTLINAIALGYVSLNVDNIDLVITIRTSGNIKRGTHIPLLIFAFNSKNNTLNDLKKLIYFKLIGGTPEGLCLDVLSNYIPNSSYYLDSYLINMSDGMPNFYIKEHSYKQEDALIHTSKVVSKIKKKNIKILSYYVTNFQVKNIWKEDFKTMYGKDAKYIDVDNINQITQTLNKLFLSKNLIS
jgi:hypothetical protein